MANIVVERSAIADFLDELPGLVMQYQQMKWAQEERSLDREDRKAGGKVSKKVGGKVVKRSMGGSAKPKKKVVFRRGGGKALRGFGKATYSNKMY